MTKLLSRFASVLMTAFIWCAACGCVAKAQVVDPAITEEEQDEIITDRPDFTESPQVVPRRFKAQIEAGYTFTRTGAAKESTIGEALVRVPIADQVELRFSVPSYLYVRSHEEVSTNSSSGGDSASGFEDAFVGAKIALAAGADKPGRITKPAVGLLFGTTLPVGARDFRELHLQPEVVVAAAADLTEAFALSSNVGYVRASDEGNQFNQFLGTLSLAASISKRVGTFVEVYGFTRIEAATRRSARYADGGVTFLVNRDFQLDARAGVGLGNDEQPGYFFGFGFARRF